MKGSQRSRNKYPNKCKRVMIDATPEQYDAFLASYPRKLDRHLTTICEPLYISYNDFTMGKWPDSIVAGCMVDDYLLTDPTKFRMNGDIKESSHKIRVMK